jgi:hypothetical protein
VQKYLSDLKARYGGIDALLLWQGYTNMGVDDRNQYDLLRSLPGGVGLDGLKALIQELHANDIQVHCFPPIVPQSTIMSATPLQGYFALLLVGCWHPP